MVYDLYTMEMGDPPIECVYPLANGDAFKTVNAAVFYAISRLYPGQPITRDETAGAISYHLFGRNWRAQLFILHTTERMATVRLHPLMPSDLIERAAWVYGTPAAECKKQMRAIFAMCHSSIANLLCRTAADVRPPDPPSDLEGALIWQEIYYPTMPDSELADRINVGHQTIRNRRKELGRPKGVRGKKDKK